MLCGSRKFSDEMNSMRRLIESDNFGYGHLSIGVAHALILASALPAFAILHVAIS